MSTRPGKANPVAIINPGNWKYGLGVGEPPNVEGLIRPDDPDPDPTDPADMPESATVLPPAGQTTFTQTATEVTIHFGEAPGDPDGYWIFGLGDREHSQAVGPTEQDVVLRQNSGTGDPYDPQTLSDWPGGSWFCVKAFKNAEVSLEQACNTFNFTPPVGPPPDPTDFLFTAPSHDRFRYNANLQGADGVELELAPDVGGNPGTFDVVAGGPGDDQITQGQLPRDVTGQPAETTKHGQIRSFNLVDLAREYSNPVGPLEATTGSLPAPGSRPNLPANFTDLLFEHDCSVWPATGSADAIDATGFGSISPSSAFGDQGNDGGTFTGAIEAVRYATSGPPGHPHVEHGPLAPHGQDFCFRVRYSRGTVEGTAIGNNSQMNFVHPEGFLVPFRAIYMHYWLLIEGVAYNGSRALRGGSQYRLAFQYNNCTQHNHGGLLVVGGNGGSTSWGVSADDGSQAVGAEFRSHAPCGGAMYTDRRESPGDWPGPRDVPGNGAHGNWLTGGSWGWNVGGPGNTIHNSSTRVPDSALEVGRWNRIEHIFVHSDVNTENGSYRTIINNNISRVAEPIMTRFTGFTLQHCPGTPADGWYYHPYWYFGFHPGGLAQLPSDTHNRYFSFADFYYAGIRV